MHIPAEVLARMPAPRPMAKVMEEAARKIQKSCAGQKVHRTPRPSSASAPLWLRFLPGFRPTDGDP